MLFLTHHGELFQIVASIKPACKFIQPWLHKWWRGCRWWWHGTHVKFVVATLLLPMIWTVNRATLLRFLCRKKVYSLTDEEGPFPGDRAFSVASYVHDVDKTYPSLRVLVITWNCLVTIGPSQYFNHYHDPNYFCNDRSRANRGGKTVERCWMPGWGSPFLPINMC